jgi:hypothetical protein
MRSTVLIHLATVIGLWAANPALSQSSKRKTKSWAFQTPVRPAIPDVQNKQWVRNPIDAFILAKLEERKLPPSPEATPEQLIRRLTFDLTGLPPTPEEIQAFVNDKSPDAYEKLVDRLLASPRYGERMALHWLDLVRYAESDGFNADDFRPNAWRYRDYVINAFNSDKPYDRFIQEQIAGDEMFPDDPQALIATGFNRHFPDEYNARNIDQRLQEILDDMTDVTGQVFLGLTVGCAKCHDHKYDPILQKDFYTLQSFYVGFSPRDDIPLATPKQIKDYETRLAEWEKQTASIREKIAVIEAPFLKKLERGAVEKFLDHFQKYYYMPAEQRTPLQQQLADMVAKQVYIDQAKIAANIKGDTKKEWDSLQDELKKFAKLKPAPLPVATGITDIGPQAPPTHLLQRGNFRNPGEEVHPAFLTILDEGKITIPPASPDAKTTGRRTILAQWLTSPDNPLTARVMVNRLWHHHFGRGIVGTPSDFGFQGEQPTHPELLDWLATEFISPSPLAGEGRGEGAPSSPSPLAGEGRGEGAKKPWSLKTMHRLMVTSTAYRQSAIAQGQGQKLDSANELFWRQNRKRLEGESLRDAMLLVSGKLNPKMGGPSIAPTLPKELIAPRGGWNVTKDKTEHYRPSIYVFVKRNLRFPLFKTFDAPDAVETCSARHVSTNAPQALALLNGEFTLEMSQSFAAKALKQTTGQPSDVVDYVFRHALGRAPDAREQEMGLTFLQRQGEIIQTKLSKKQKLALPAEMPKGVDQAHAAAVVELCHVMFNLNEFIYVD